MDMHTMKVLRPAAVLVLAASFFFSCNTTQNNSVTQLKAVVSVSPGTTINAGDTFEFEVAVSGGSANGAYTYKWYINDTLQKNADNSTVTWETTSDAGGSYTVSVTVSDSRGRTAEDSIDVTIIGSAANHDPTISSLTASPSATVTAGASVTFTASASDQDGDTLSYTWKVGSLSQSSVGNTMVLSTSGYSAGVYSIQVTVTDGMGGSATQTIDLTVITQVVNRAPTVNITLNSGTLYSDEDITFTANASDADGDALSYTWYVNSNDVGCYASTMTRYWLVSSTIIASIKVTVSDGHGGSTSATASPTITAAGSLRVYNHASNPIEYLYSSETGSSTWGSDLLGTSMLASGNYFVVYGYTVNLYYDFKAIQANTGTSSDTTSAHPSGFQMLAGQHRDFHIYTDTYSVLANSTTTVRGLASATIGVNQAGNQSLVLKSSVDGAGGQFHAIKAVQGKEPEGVPLER